MKFSLKSSVVLFGIVLIIVALYFPVKDKKHPWYYYFDNNPFHCINTHKLHLSFDDGPMDTGTTRDVLEALKKNGVLASFFIQTDRFFPEIMDKERDDTDLKHSPIELPEFEKYRYGSRLKVERSQRRIQLLKQIQNDGHLIGSHAHVHRLLSRWPESSQELEEYRKNKHWRWYSESFEDVVENISTSINVLKGFGLEVQFVRFPYGGGAFWPKFPGTKKRERSRRLVKAVSEMGLLHVGWNIDSLDYSYSKMLRDPKSRKPLSASDRYHRMTTNLARQICRNEGGIVLFHDNYQAAPKYLSQWVRLIETAGHQFVSLKEIAPACFEEKSRKRLLDNVTYAPKTHYLKQCWN